MSSASRTAFVIERVVKERRRQDELKAAGRFRFTCADYGMLDADKLCVLTEEVGEVAREVLSLATLVTDGAGKREALRQELVQVAAIAVAWIEALVQAGRLRCRLPREADPSARRLPTCASRRGAHEDVARGAYLHGLSEGSRMSSASRTAFVIERVVKERRRRCGLDCGMLDADKLCVLTEEVGEVAREVLSLATLVTDGAGKREALRQELVQVAAIAVAWIEALE